jgi:hypothetical protein
VGWVSAYASVCVDSHARQGCTMIEQPGWGEDM